MCDARCTRWPRIPSPWLASRRSSGTCPAVLHRHCPTENRVTGLTQSRALRSDSNVSVSPNPKGLTTPAATTATRALAFFPLGLLGLAMVGRKKLPRDFYCFLRGSILQVSPNENEARTLVDCQLSLFSDDLKSDRREQ